jgi:hypothetical protein
MGSRPIDVMAVRTPVKLFLLIKNEVRHFSLGFLPCDLVKKRITEEAPGEEGLLIQGNDSLDAEFFEL